MDGHVQLLVEDSGSGIPKEKRELLFSRYNERLDVLSQGTVSYSLLFSEWWVFGKWNDLHRLTHLLLLYYFASGYRSVPV